MRKVIFNGELVAEGAALVSLGNKDVQLGLSVFETMLAVDGEVRGWGLHMDRLWAGVDRMGIREGEGLRDGDLLERVGDLLLANGLDEGRVKVRVTVICDFYLIEAEEAPVRGEVCRVMLSDYVRNERSPLVGVKCGSYAENVMALSAGREAGFDEVVFLNSEGDVAECATANVFVVKGGVLYTPDLGSGCLPGVTRELVMEAARRIGVIVHEGLVSLAFLLDADEVFLTNTLIGVQAVSCIGDLEFEVVPGVMTLKIREEYLG